MTTLTHEQIKILDAKRWFVKVGKLPKAFVLCKFLGWQYVICKFFGRQYTIRSHWLTRDGECVTWLPSNDELQELIVAEAQRRQLKIAMDWHPPHWEMPGWWARIGNDGEGNDSDLIVALVRAVAALESER